jgi:hypothetical protein
MWSVSHSSRFISGEPRPGTNWIRGLVGPRAGLDDVEKMLISPLPGLELRRLGHPTRSQSLYQLRYWGSALRLKTLLELEVSSV